MLEYSVDLTNLPGSTTRVRKRDISIYVVLFCSIRLSIAHSLSVALSSLIVYPLSISISIYMNGYRTPLL